LRCSRRPLHHRLTTWHALIAGARRGPIPQQYRPGGRPSWVAAAAGAADGRPQPAAGAPPQQRAWRRQATRWVVHGVLFVESYGFATADLLVDMLSLDLMFLAFVPARLRATGGRLCGGQHR